MLALTFATMLGLSLDFPSSGEVGHTLMSLIDSPAQHGELGLTAKFSADMTQEDLDRAFICFHKCSHVEKCPPDALHKIAAAEHMLSGLDPPPLAHAWLRRISDSLTADGEATPMFCVGFSAPASGKLYLIGSRNASREAFPNLPVSTDTNLFDAIPSTAGGVEEGEVVSLEWRASGEKMVVLRHYRSPSDLNTTAMVDTWAAAHAVKQHTYLNIRSAVTHNTSIQTQLIYRTRAYDPTVPTSRLN
jgi:hypothetical protein